MRIHQETLSIQPPGRGLVLITREVEKVVARAAMRRGLCTVFIRHTSASLLIQENADPSVRDDLISFFDRLVPEGPHYTHDAEGPDDMPAHIRAALTQCTLSVPLLDGALALGTWQGVYLFEHRRRAGAREVVVQVLGE